MKHRRYLISSILAAGFGLPTQAQADFTHATTTGAGDPNKGRLLRQFSQEHLVTLASHSSHSSHSSHASHSSGGGGGGHYSHSSHTSHRSGSGGYYSDPAPTYVTPTYVSPPPPPPRTVAPPPASPTLAQPLFGSTNRATPPPADGLPALSGRTSRFKMIVRRVELALLAQDYYSGTIDGVVGPTLRSALRKFQKDRNLEVTGTITPLTLDALMISSQ